MSKPYVPTGTKTKFYRPPTLAADFTEFLDNDLPNMVMDFTILKDWYDQFADDYEAQTIRGEFYMAPAKSRYSNTDNEVDLRCDVNSGIRKGDMLIASNNNDVYIVDWDVTLQTNNAPTRALRCNLNLNAERYFKEEVDEQGYLIQEEGWRNIIKDLPANAYFYDGRAPSYYAASGNPGISPEVNALLTVQYNPETARLKVKDEFTWGNDRYYITDISYSGVDRLSTHGVLFLQTLQKPGGIQ